MQYVIERLESKRGTRRLDRTCGGYRVGVMLACLVVTGVGCGDMSGEGEQPAEAVESHSVEETTVVVEEAGKADGASSRLHLRTVLRAGRLFDGTATFELTGRSARRWADVEARVVGADRSIGEVEMSEQGRSFSIALPADELGEVWSGAPLALSLEPRGNLPPRRVELTLAPGFVGFSGTSQIWIESRLTAVVVDRQVVMRGRVRAEEELSGLWIYGERDIGPRVHRAARASWSFDWTSDELSEVLAPGAGPITFAATTPDGITREKSAYLAPRIVDIRRRTTPSQPPGCTEEVRACLAALPVQQGDTQECGGAREVLACHRDRGELPGRFADDLWEYLGEHYRDVGPELLEAGGRGLWAARAQVRRDRVRVEGDWTEVDPVRFRVVSHPDPIFSDPSSDEPVDRWVGIYRRGEDGPPVRIELVGDVR
jgi:hypothetical protein